jgi:hypothetical protein
MEPPPGALGAGAARGNAVCVLGSKRTRELGRDMLLAASIVKFSVPKAHMGETREKSHSVSAEKKLSLSIVEIFLER